MLNRSTIGRLALPLLTCGLITVALFLPWRTYFTNIGIIVSGSLWFLFFFRNKEFLSREALQFILLLSSLYFIELVGMIYTENVSYGLHRLESKLSLVVFPLIILGSGIGRTETDKISVMFIVSTVSACLWCLMIALIELFRRDGDLSTFLTDVSYTNIALTEPIQGLHPTFLTLFICLSIFIIADYLRKNKTAYWLIAVIAFLFLFALQLASRAGIAALLLTVVFIGISFLNRKNKWVLPICLIALMIISIMTIASVPSLKSRLIDSVLEADINKEASNSVTYHYRSWTCSVEKWLEGHILFGYGTGDEVNTLTQCYHEKGWLGYGHDAHNEFLSSLVKHGLVGLLVLCVSFFIPFYLAIKYNDLRYVCFLTIILICFMSESMLRGQTGLVFFTLFNSLFLKNLLNERSLVSKSTRFSGEI